MTPRPQIRSPQYPAFALIELLAATAISALLLIALTIATSETRRQAALSDDLANLKHYAGNTFAFAADHNDRIWSLDWLPDTTYTVVENGVTRTLTTPSNRAGPLAMQAGHFLRTRAGIPVPDLISNWLPTISFNYLVLADYLDAELPARWAVSSGDATRIAWQEAMRRDPSGGEYFDLPNRPFGEGPLALRPPFTSGFELGPAFYARDAIANGVRTLEQSPASHNWWLVGDAPFGDRRLSEVRFPSQKAMVYDQYQRHFGPRIAFFPYAEARIPILTADGAAAVRATGTPLAPPGTTNDTNAGFSPNIPGAPSNPGPPTRFNYNPDTAWEPPELGNPNILVTGFYRWTRSGLRGRDFGGPEVLWVP